MAVRPDAKLLADFVRGGALTPKQAEERIRLPLLDINLHNLYDHNPSYRAMRDDVSKNWDSLKDLYFGSSDLFILEDFMAKLNDDNGWIYARVQAKEGSIHTVEIFADTGFSAYSIMQVEEENGQVVMGFTGAYEKGKYFKTALDDNRTKQRDLVAFCSSMVTSILVYLRYHNEQDHYCIGASPTKVDKKVPGLKGRLNQVAGPSIVYLDKFPRVYVPSESVSERYPNAPKEERAPHHRRGTWRTLRAERYKHHPKYLVEKGVYVKPSWVGDKEAIIEGTVYRLLEV